MVVALLGLRFVLELALVASVGLLGTQLSDNAPLGWALALGLAGVVIVVWGVFLSPRRRVDLPLGVRIVIELALFVVAAWGLVHSGHPTWGLVLIVAEVAVLGGLWLMGLPPGSDADGRMGTRPP